MTSVTDVEFFFDPSCPWTWVTSRWLVTVAADRQLAVTWRPWSLVLKNEGRELPADLPAVWRERILAGRAFAAPALRVLEAAGTSNGNTSVGNEARGRLYTEMGRRYHDADRGDDATPDPGQLIASAVAAAGLPDELAEAGGDASWDAPIRDTMDEVRRQVGDDVGVPIIAIRGPDGLHAIAGPIMAEVPPRERALSLWDAVATVVIEPAVFELKRHRTASTTLPRLAADGSVEDTPTAGAGA